MFGGRLILLILFFFFSNNQSEQYLFKTETHSEYLNDLSYATELDIYKSENVNLILKGSHCLDLCPTSTRTISEPSLLLKNYKPDI